MFLTLALSLMAICVLGMLTALFGLIYQRKTLSRRPKASTDTRSLAAVEHGPDGFLHLKGVE